MKTWRALFVGCAIGAGLGYLFAPRHGDMLRAQLHVTRQDQHQRLHQQSTPTRGNGTATAGIEMAATGTARSTGAYVGNTQTRIYHAATAPNLPGEDNRAYFASRAEAEDAGYRPSAQLASAQ